MDRPVPGTHLVTVQTLTFEGAAAVCRAYEEAFVMDSADFYKRYVRGDFIGDRNGQAAANWAAYWEEFLELRPEAEGLWLVGS